MIKHMHTINLKSLLALSAMLLMFSAVVTAQEPGVGDPDAMAMMRGAAEPKPDLITPQEVKKLIDSKADNFLLVDNSPAEAFAEEHIVGAVNLPWVQAITSPVTLPRNKMLILYCPCGPGDADSTDMSKKLRRIGYFNTKVMEGGYFKWLDLGYPIYSKDNAKEN